MPAKDVYHSAVRNALVKDGWTISDDPFRIRWGKRDYYVDLGAVDTLGAWKDGRRIAVECKSFIGNSLVDDVEKALGQVLLYQAILARKGDDHDVFLAVPKLVAKLFDEPLGELLLEDFGLRVIVFDPKREEILQWL